MIIGTVIRYGKWSGGKVFTTHYLFFVFSQRLRMFKKSDLAGQVSLFKMLWRRPMLSLMVSFTRFSPPHTLSVELPCLHVFRLSHFLKNAISCSLMLFPENSSELPWLSHPGTTKSHRAVLPSRVLSTVLRLEPYLLQILLTHRISSTWFLYFFVYAACALALPV